MIQGRAIRSLSSRPGPSQTQPCYSPLQPQAHINAPPPLITNDHHSYPPSVPHPTSLSPYIHPLFPFSTAEMSDLASHLSPSPLWLFFPHLLYVYINVPYLPSVFLLFLTSSSIYSTHFPFLLSILLPLCPCLFDPVSCPLHPRSSLCSLPPLLLSFLCRSGQ